MRASNSPILITFQLENITLLIGAPDIERINGTRALSVVNAIRIARSSKSSS